MARKARQRSESRIYHVLLRGTGSRNIFSDDDDKSKMKQILLEKKQDYAFFVYSYCILDNHMHLVIKEGKDTVTRSVKRISTTYAYYYNTKYNYTGRVFQDRFKSEAIDGSHMLADAVRFVHQNSEKSGSGDMLEYEWSSCREYAFDAGPDRLADTGPVLDLFSRSAAGAFKEFYDYNRRETDGGFIDIATEKAVGQHNVYEFINRYLDRRRIRPEELSRPEHKDLRDDLIRKLIKESNLSRRGIAEALGINRETVRKAGLAGTETKDKTSFNGGEDAENITRRD